MNILKIGANWCSSCLVMRPRLKKIENKFPNLKTKYYDYDTSPKITQKYNLKDTHLPTFIFLNKNNQEITRLRGEVSIKKFTELIKQHQAK